LEVAGLCKQFPLRAGAFAGHGAALRAVHNVSFTLERGRTLGLVGESGCGKSTTGRLILRLIEPSSGSVKLDGAELTALPARALKPLRRRMQLVFQDPLGSLNPRHSVGQILAEPLVVHGVPRREHGPRVAELLRDVELPPEAMHRYPHEFSGGQRQRIAIARALALRPELVVADEPVSALDASIQSQILTLLKRLQAEHGIALLFISHDLGVVRYLCDEVAVMYFGEIVEHGPAEAVLSRPRHPYTQALLAAIPQAAADAPPVAALGGSLPDPTLPPPGCPFASRCAQAMPRCTAEAPPDFAVGAGHSARCWLNEAAARESVEVRHG
jgi:oligopeptide/dipeptide ABC transporter ATP-binding protein